MNAFQHSFFTNNQGVIIHNHPISLFTIITTLVEYWKVLLPYWAILYMPTHANMHFLNALSHVVYEHFCSQSSSIGQCLYDTIVHEFSCKDFIHPWLPEVPPSVIQVLFPESYPAWVSMTHNSQFKSANNFRYVSPYPYTLCHIILNVFMSVNTIKFSTVSTVMQLSLFSCQNIYIHQYISLLIPEKHNKHQERS
jgi:hypothetical protein